MAEDRVRTAACACGAFTLTLTGAPLKVSSCACTRCQRRTGSFYGVTAYFRPDQMTARGVAATFHRPDGAATFHFCPTCGSTLWWAPDDAGENVIGVAGGAFADPSLPAPTRLVWASRAHSFVCTPPEVVEHPGAAPEVTG